MRAGYPETDKTAACTTLYLAFCMFVYGLFGFSFYEMLQPRHIANLGQAAYKPPVKLLGHGCYVFRLVEAAVLAKSSGTLQGLKLRCPQRRNEYTSAICASGLMKRRTLIQRVCG